MARGDPKNLIAIGITFVVLSVATAIWYWARGESVDVSVFGIIAGGLLVLAVGLYWQRRRRYHEG